MTWKEPVHFYRAYALSDQKRSELMQGQIKGEGRPLALTCMGFETQDASMGLNNTSGNVEAQARTLAGTGWLQTHVGTEELTDICRINSGSLVMHADMRAILRRLYTDCDGSTFVGVFNSIIKQVSQRLLQATTIPVSRNGCIGNLDD